MNTIDYLRISVIDRCNFRCSYCMPEDVSLSYLPPQAVLSDRELLFLVQEVFLPLGINKFRLTGGEPLLRRGIVDLVRAITQIPGVRDLALTTNGYFLSELATPLHQAGLRRLNISLDSLDPQIFAQITGRDRWQQVWQGILAAYGAGFNPLKFNVVVMPDINEHEVLDLAALTLNRAWHVRFIEFMPIGNTARFESVGWVTSADLRTKLRDRFGLSDGQCLGNGPADVFQIPGALGTVGFISQMSECFCDRCNRLRLSADGWLRPCLLNESGQVNLRDALRQETDATALQRVIRDLITAKTTINFKERDRGTQSTYSRTMSQIGG